jgi:hypothetical protein
MRSGDSAYAMRITSRWGARGVYQGMLKCSGMKEWRPIRRGEVHRGKIHRGEIHRGEIHRGEIHRGKVHGGTVHRGNTVYCCVVPRRALLLQPRGMTAPVYVIIRGEQISVCQVEQQGRDVTVRGCNQSPVVVASYLDLVSRYGEWRCGPQNFVGPGTVP